MEKYLNDLINQKQNIVNILTSYGVSATTNERLNTLIPKLRSCVEYANAIQKTVSGNPISVGDVSSTQHNLQVTVKSKNLISTDNIEVSGTGTWTSKILTKQPLPNGTYTFSCEYENLTENITTIGIVVRDIDEKWISETYGNNGTIKLTFSTTNGISIYLYSNMGSQSTFTDIIFKNIQLEEGSTATSYTPYRTEFEGVEISRYGKNLIPFPYISSSGTLNGVEFTVNGDGSISTKGTATSNIYFDLCVVDFGTINMYGGYSYDNGYSIKDCTYDANNKKVYINVNNGTTINKTYYPQIELGISATEYEPYKEPQTATANSEGVVEGLTSLSPNMTLMSDNGVIIDCTYNTDTKTYIDNKVLALQTAMVGG